MATNCTKCLAPLDRRTQRAGGEVCFECATSTRRATLYDGDTFDHQGYTFRVEMQPDTDTGPPWENADGHGIVSEWTTRAKRPGERVLATDHSAHRYYDVAATMQIARRDQWGTRDGRRPGETQRAYTARAVEADFDYLRRWCADIWQYIGVIVTWVDDEDISDSLWGVESLGNYPTEVAYELADNLMARIEVDEPDAVRSEN